MKMTQALFYPWIDIKDEAWLKTALLYWDSIRTIVPESINDPYSTDTGRVLQDASFLIPLRVHSGMEEIEDLASDVLTYLGTTEGAELLIATRGGRRCDIHLDKLPYELGRLADIHPEKLPYEILHLLHDFATPSGRGGDWLRVDEKFANFYMTLLASRLSERVGARLLTSLASSDRLAVTARFDAQLNGVIPWGRHPRWRHWREYDAFGPRHRMPRHLAPGMLANLAIERIGIAPDTPIDRLIEFREKHRDELAQFRSKIEQLAASVEENLTAEALHQRVADLYTGEVVPAISNLKSALDGHRIKWLGDGLLKIAFLSAGSSTMLVMAGLAVPTALLAGAGISLIATGTMYNVDKRESLRTNPFAYLLSAERELA
jgi:hypothetical protein